MRHRTSGDLGADLLWWARIGPDRIGWYAAYLSRGLRRGRHRSDTARTYRPEKMTRGGQVMANKPVRPRRQAAPPLPPRGFRGSDSLSTTPARTVQSLTPEEQAQSARYSDTDFDD